MSDDRQVLLHVEEVEENLELALGRFLGSLKFEIFSGKAVRLDGILRHLESWQEVLIVFGHLLAIFVSEHRNLDGLVGLEAAGLGVQHIEVGGECLLQLLLLLEISSQ